MSPSTAVGRKRAETHRGRLTRLGAVRNHGAVRNAEEKTSKKRMAKKLYVGGLSWDTTDESLRGAFEQYGTVSEAVVITDRDTGRSRGFGFVSFEAPEDADKAVEGLNGTSLDGRTIRVDEARERAPRDGGGDRRNNRW
jgi:RNA recognition motif-containing protein